MKDLMIGNKAVARGIFESGCTVISSYPGTPSTEITEYAADYPEMHCEWAPNEKVALEVAFGASLAGARSACAMKHVGMNVAADPLFTLSYTGVNGGLVICVADDPGMHSSQNEQDSRHYAVSAKVPMLEPADSTECKEFAKAAFELSERFDTPVMLRLCTRIAHAQSLVELGERENRENIKYEKNGAKYIMMPGNAKKRHPVVEARTAAIAEYAENCPFNRIEGNGTMGIITSGTCYQYVKEVFGDDVKILKLGIVNPMPVKLIRDFAASVEKLYVVEELDPVIEEHCLSIGVKLDGGKDMFPPIGEFSQQFIASAFGKEIGASVDANVGDIPMRPPVMCAGCPHRGMFYTLAKNKVTVLGDIGCYTLGAQAPLFAIDSTLCMGASVSGLHGFNLAGGEEAEKKSVAVIGDSTFLHSGVTGLINIAYNATNSTVIILDNSITGMTGHQQNPATGMNLRGEPAAKIDLEALCRAVGINRVRVVDPYDLKACNEAVKEELAVSEPSVIISRRPCVLLKTVKAKKPLIVDEAKCRGCKACMRLGCPAISMKNGKAKIDATLCVGCGVCKQLCAFDAITDGEDK
ncbi:MAG: indolepyruvate ferredoxin oxidoreductase subunit alpha [Ruminococcaceae bacterium]|nr:indolepyruvate ferredoxin oxidoreductase subunit alpha [Oscillospiraceae bacterium]